VELQAPIASLFLPTITIVVMQHHHHDGNDEQDDDDEVDLPTFLLVDDAQCLVKIPSSNSDGDVGGGSHYYCNLPCPHCEKGENEGMRRKFFFSFTQ
jgi:hypothetical protein